MMVDSEPKHLSPRMPLDMRLKVVGELHHAAIRAQCGGQVSGANIIK